jgi:hypothetical protein
LNFQHNEQYNLVVKLDYERAKAGARNIVKTHGKLKKATTEKNAEHRVGKTYAITLYKNCRQIL